MMSRTAIFAALFARVSALNGFTTTSRTLRSFTETPAGEQPALFQSEGNQEALNAPPAPTKWTFHAELTVYAHANNLPSSGGDLVDLLNTLVDAVVAALAPDPGQANQTLGGLVTAVRIDGAIETDEGRLGQQAVAIIPVLIIANL